MSFHTQQAGPFGESIPNPGSAPESVGVSNGELGSPLRCLVVDDESPARDEIRFLLDEQPGVQVVGSAATAEEALVLLENLSYDIVFLDIRMPGADGLELARLLQDRIDPPEVVFTTAYRDYAVDAFELSAADYILKPLSAERLMEAVERAYSRIATRRGLIAKAAVTADLLDGLESGSAESSISPIRRHSEDAEPSLGRLPVQRGDRTVFVNELDIVAAAAAHGYSYIYLSSERVLVNYSLTELEQRLSNSFFRVHRSYLANLNRLVELRPDFKGALTVVMDDDAKTRVPVSRRQAQELRKRLGL